MYSPGEWASKSQTRSLAALNSSAASTHAKLSSLKTLMMSKELCSTERTSLGPEPLKWCACKVTGVGLARYPVNRLPGAMNCLRSGVCIPHGGGLRKVRGNSAFKCEG